MSNKLFKLKEWLTLDEAADYISVAIGEPVLVKDILRLALDKHLVLSVDFVNHTEGVEGELVGPEGVKVGDKPAPWFQETLKKIALEKGGDPKEVYEEIVLSLSLGDGLFFNKGEKLSSVTGVWDLPLWGNEHLDVLHKYQKLIGGPQVTLTCLEGTFVRRGSVAFELQEDFDDNEFQKGSKAHGDKLEQLILKNRIDKKTATEIREEYHSDRAAYLEERKDKSRESNYYPAGKLPDDAVYVVRTEEALRFLSSLEERNNQEQPLNTREKNTLLVLLATMCKQASFDWTERGISSAMEQATEELGVHISDDTIRKVLKQIPEAIESRQK